MNINNRFLDESKIIKKKINEKELVKDNIKDHIKEPIKEPIKETLSDEIKEQINKSVNEPIKKAAAKKEKAKKQYEELLKEVIEETPEVVPEQQKRNDIEIAVETKPIKKDKPIYQYGRDKNDNPVILNRGAEELIQDNKEPEYTNRTACISLKIRQTEKELINLSVDLDVYAKLLELYNSEPKKTIFTNRVKAITDDITVNEQKLKILKDLMQKLSN